jgi:hypothetical protein
MKQFKTLGGIVIPDIAEYVREYISSKEDVELLIASDSQCYGNYKTVYGVVIALYTPGKGAHVLCNREVTPMEFDTSNRLMTEVWKSVQVAEYLRENGLPKPKFIDIDLNPDPKYRSNKVLRQAIGFVEGMGYKARYKHDPGKHGEAVITYAANHLVRL